MERRAHLLFLWRAVALSRDAANLRAQFTLYDKTPIRCFEMKVQFVVFLKAISS